MTYIIKQLNEYVGRFMQKKSCLNCKNISPLENLEYRKGELEGGELYVLKESIKQRKVLLCEISTPMMCISDLWSEITNITSFDFTPPLLFISLDCTYDFKASGLLALTAHYRNAIQLLRPILENIIVACYFEERIRASSSQGEIDQAWKEYDQWVGAERKYKYNNLKNYKINKQNFLSSSELERLDKELWEPISEYLHTNREKTDTAMDNLQNQPYKLPMTTRYDKEKLYKWLDLYQNLSSYHIEKLMIYYPPEDVGYNAKDIFQRLNILKQEGRYLNEHLDNLMDLIGESI
ncbi:MAG: hypothetical protein A4E48_01970 [Methanosaeta sp. PtaU1.Bin060]|nr:MAG: hypothetical protein A4E48_01970 [Methanosaeta sp. PtaU1.Bin060]